MQAATSSDWIYSNVERCGPMLRPETSVAVAIAHLQSQRSPCVWVSQALASASQNSFLPPVASIEGYVTATHLLRLIATPDPAGRNPLEQPLGAIAHPPSVITASSVQTGVGVEATARALRGDHAPWFLVVDQFQRVQGQISREALQQAVIEQLLFQRPAAMAANAAGPAAFSSPVASPTSAATTSAVHPELQAALVQLSQALSELETHGQAEAQLQHRIGFEALLTQISAEFLNLRDGEIDQALHTALARTAGFTQCDRACIFQYSQDGREAHCRHEWNRDNLIPFTKPLCSILRHTFPWSLAQMQQQQVVHVPDVSLLPAEAAPERNAAQQLQAQSYVVIPLCFKGEPLGWLAFYAVHQPKTWAPADLRQLETLGSIVAGVIARQRAETALEELETKFAQLVENLAQIFFIYQTEPFQLLYVSPAYEAIWGLSTAMLYEQPDHWESIVHPEDYDRVMVEINRRRTEGVSVDLEYRIIRPDGEERWIHSRSFPLRDHQGAIYRIAGIAEDVSDRHRYEAALARSEEKFSKAFRFNPIPMAITVMGEGRYLEVNDAFCQHSGFSRQDVVGKTMAELDILVEPRQWDRIDQALSEQGSFQNLELHLRNRQGQIRITQCSGTLLDVDGQSRVLSLCCDITEQRQQETQRQKMEQALRQATRAAQAANQAKGECLAMVSHEIRTPLNAILSMSELLLEDGLSPSQQEKLELLRNGGEVLLEILDEVLDFSRLDASEFSIEIAPFELKACLEEVQELFLPQAHAQGLELHLELSPQLPHTLLSDSKRLKQILNNLLCNAIKFSTSGQIRIAVCPSEAAPDEILFLVQDQGIGIHQGGLDRLFEPYSQADASIAQRYGGTGLGLNICDRLVRRLGGTIWVESGGNIGGSPPEGWALRQGKSSPAAMPSEPAKPSDPAKPAPDPAWAAQATSAEAADADQSPFNGGSCREPLPHQDSERHSGSHFYFTLPQAFSTQAEPLSELPSEPLSPTRHVHGTASSKDRDEQTPVPAGMAENRSEIPGPPVNSALPLPPSRVSILLIEDIQLNQKVARLLLQRLGYGAELAASGQAAIAALEERPYDIVLLDLNLPGLSGYQIYQHLQGLPQRPWVIAMSAAVDETSRDRCHGLGMNDFIAKPISQPSLTQALARFWQHSQQHLQPSLEPSLPGQSVSEQDLRHSAAADTTNFPPCISNAPSLRQEIFSEVQQICGDAPSFQALLMAYRTDAQEQLTGLIQAQQHRDSMALFKAIHSLGPAASSLGGQRLAELCAHLENQLRTQGCCPREAGAAAMTEPQWQAIAPQLEEIQAEHQRLAAAMEFQTWDVE